MAPRAAAGLSRGGNAAVVEGQGGRSGWLGDLVAERRATAAFYRHEGVNEAAGTGGTGAGFPLGIEVAGSGEWRAR